MKDFYLKLYDRNKNFKSKKNHLIIWKTNYSAQINWGYSDLSIKIQTSIDDQTYQTWDFIRIFYKNRLYYAGYIYYIDGYLSEDSWEYIELKLMSAGWLFGSKSFIMKYFPYKKTSEILSNLLSWFNEQFWTEIIKNPIVRRLWDLTWRKFVNFKWVSWKDLNKWFDGSVDFSAAQKRTYLNHIKELYRILSLWNFFIWFDWEIIMKGQTHLLLFKKHISEFRTGRVFDVIKSENLNNQIQIKINNSYNYLDIKPGDQIKILNLKKEIEPKVVSKISYNDNWADIELESFNSFTNLIKTLWQ